MLDDKTLLKLAGRTDAAGVLSVYVNDDPARDPNATAIDLKNRYRELQRRIAEEGPADRRRESNEALDRLAPELDERATTLESGRGRIMSAALGDDGKMRRDRHVPVPIRVVLDVG